MDTVQMVKGLVSAFGGHLGDPQAGQAHTEYGIILVLIGITVIGSVLLMGHTVQDMFHNVSTAMPR